MSIPIPITSLLGLAYIIAACFLYISLSSILSSRQNTAKARQLKCQDPPELKSRYLIGTDLLLRLRSADKAKLFPVGLIQRFVDVGDTTYKYTLPGGHYHHVSTMDSKNILANLATQLKDFDLGSTRRRKFLFAREQVSDLNLEETHVQNLMRALNLSLTSGNWIESVDLGVLFIRLTLDSATEFFI
ncbi:Cytochrome P450 [Lachnellula hyalina]|uniref:Cytochrome P450 n=1 Tax=Lachnellula hyalina TaxID=1316788 RepID=A0A8H8U004_9HELO|nr:Cytochrome P450 [Lachnellula hyalina]TVY26422.1 Cytochrome P450 [Lachnellula hyalina]